eukprot:m.217357 g.217357  ORF g.217357 m.217357 type:complete len:129 (-) comp15557_c0_seq1:572-958(-)
MFVSMCFMISSQMNHLNHVCADVSDRDYYRHQVITSHSLMDDGLTGYLALVYLHWRTQLPDRAPPLPNHQPLPSPQDCAGSSDGNSQPNECRNTVLYINSSHFTSQFVFDLTTTGDLIFIRSHEIVRT